MISEKQAKTICNKLKQAYASHAFLSRGNHNEVFTLRTNQQEYVVRVQNNPDGDLRCEYNLIKKIPHLAPKVYLFDNSATILKEPFMVMEKVQGKHPTRKVTTQFAKAMGAWYKHLHTHKKKGKQDSPIKSFKSFKRVRQQPLYDDYLPIFEKAKDLYARRTSLRLIHGDATRTNVFFYKGKVKLIDWEMAEYGTPEIDLAFFEYAYDLTRPQRSAFYEAYGYPKTQQAESRINLQKSLLLWALQNWRMGRLEHLRAGRLDTRQEGSNEKNILAGYDKDEKSLRALLSSL